MIGAAHFQGLMSQLEISARSYFVADIVCDNIVALPFILIYQANMSGNQVTIVQSQLEVIRTNCFDSVDRTGLVQAVLARSIIYQQLLHESLAPAADPSVSF